jgi:DNA-directed RNA polymerase subunit RPC12/RpoP
MVKRVLKRTQYPCGTCSQDCEVPSRPAVFCGECISWFHADCQHLTNAQMDVLENHVSQDYICSSCSQQDGNLDYHSSLQRLAFATRGRLRSLHSAVILEGIILRNLPLRIPTNENVDIQSMNIDYLAQTLIDQLGKNHVNYVMPYYYLTPDE